MSDLSSQNGAFCSHYPQTSDEIFLKFIRTGIGPDSQLSGASAMIISTSYSGSLSKLAWLSDLVGWLPNLEGEGWFFPNV